jgi:hypothetical protein
MTTNGVESTKIQPDAPRWFMVCLTIATVPVPISVLISFFCFYGDKLRDDGPYDGVTIGNKFWLYSEMMLAVSLAYGAVMVAIWFFLPIVAEMRREARMRK